MGGGGSEKAGGLIVVTEREAVAWEWVIGATKSGQGNKNWGQLVNWLID